MRASDEILVRKALLDYDRGLEDARARLRLDHNRLVAATIDKVLMTAVRTIHLRENMEDDVRFLLTLAHATRGGADAHELAEEHLDRILRLDRLKLIVRVHDAGFQTIRDACRAAFAARLPDLAHMAAVENPHDYDDLLLQAYPDPAAVDAIIEANVKLFEVIVQALEREPSLLRVPKAIVKNIVATTNDIVHLEAKRVRRNVRDLYASRAN